MDEEELEVPNTSSLVINVIFEGMFRKSVWMMQL